MHGDADRLARVGDAGRCRVSDDAKRLPLAALGVMEFGAVRATLKGYSRPGEANARAENKANIKW